MTDEEMVVDVIGIDPPIANALRRIIISEVPTIAIGIALWPPPFFFIRLS